MSPPNCPIAKINHPQFPSKGTKRNTRPPAAGGIIYKIYQISRALSASRRKKNNSRRKKHLHALSALLAHATCWNYLTPPLS